MCILLEVLPHLSKTAQFLKKKNTLRNFTKAQIVSKNEQTL